MFHSETASNVFLSVQRWRNLTSQQSAVILDLRLKNFEKKLGQGNYIIIVPFFDFQNVLRPHENEKLVFLNSSGFKSVFEKFRFRDGLVWTVSRP